MCGIYDSKKQEIQYVENELSRMMNLLDYQLETMPGIELVTASALVAVAEIGDINRFPTNWHVLQVSLLSTSVPEAKVRTKKQAG